MNNEKKDTPNNPQFVFDLEKLQQAIDNSVVEKGPTCFNTKKVLQMMQQEDENDDFEGFIIPTTNDINDKNDE